MLCSLANSTNETNCFGRDPVARSFACFRSALLFRNDGKCPTTWFCPRDAQRDGTPHQRQKVDRLEGGIRGVGSPTHTRRNPMPSNRLPSSFASTFQEPIRVAKSCLALASLLMTSCCSRYCAKWRACAKRSGSWGCCPVC